MATFGLGGGRGEHVHSRAGLVGRQKFLMLKGASSRNTALAKKPTQTHSISGLDPH